MEEPRPTSSCSQLSDSTSLARRSCPHARQPAFHCYHQRTSICNPVQFGALQPDTTATCSRDLRGTNRRPPCLVHCLVGYAKSRTALLSSTVSVSSTSHDQSVLDFFFLLQLSRPAILRRTLFSRRSAFSWQTAQVQQRSFRYEQQAGGQADRPHLHISLGADGRMACMGLVGGAVQRQRRCKKWIRHSARAAAGDMR